LKAVNLYCVQFSLRFVVGVLSNSESSARKEKDVTLKQNGNRLLDNVGEK